MGAAILLGLLVTAMRLSSSGREAEMRARV
jgi:hypothetical protein